MWPASSVRDTLFVRSQIISVAGVMGSSMKVISRMTILTKSLNRSQVEQTDLKKEATKGWGGGGGKKPNRIFK